MPTPKKFCRRFDTKTCNNLLASSLFNDYILPDIQDVKPNNKVFPAIRVDRVDFYHAGGKLFSYGKDGQFTTHSKYASVIQHRTKSKPYIKESELPSHQLIENFENGYNDIKNNCRLYSGVEAEGVSDLYSRSFYHHNSDPVIALDIEVSFQAKDNGPENTNTWIDSGPAKARRNRRQDRVDLLLYDREYRRLIFVEAKHFTNPEMWSQESIQPDVVKQVQRYESQIAERRPEILEAYKDYVLLMRKLLNLKSSDLPIPKTVFPRVVLWLFGFTKHQKAKIAQLLINDSSIDKILFRPVGNTKTTATKLLTLRSGRIGCY